MNLHGNFLTFIAVFTYFRVKSVISTTEKALTGSNLLLDRELVEGELRGTMATVAGRPLLERSCYRAPAKRSLPFEYSTLL